MDTILLQNDRVSMTIVPAAGGKIVELRDRLSGRNWLWRNPHIPVSRPKRDANFEQELDSGGWDEVLLSVKPGHIEKSNGHFGPVPDHGDLLSSDWAVDVLRRDAGNNLECAMSTNGSSGHYHFSRHIRMVEHSSVVEFRYRLRNNSEQPLPGYWCAHPLLSIESGAFIDIDEGMPMRIEDIKTQAKAARDGDQKWPTLIMSDGASVDLSQSFAPSGSGPAAASKVFVKTPMSGSASVVLRSGDRLTFRLDADELPWLGLWINNGEWSGCGSEPYTNLGIEPATSPYDCINEAIDNDAVAWLQPGEEKRWSLTVEMQS